MGINILEARRRVMMEQPHIETAVGNPVSFKAEALPLQELKVAINPVQDLHGQSSPYPPGGGVNLLPTPVDGTYEANGAKAVVKDGVITLSGTTTSSGNVAIIPLASVVSVPVGTYIHLLNSSVNERITVGFELVSDISSTCVSFSPSPINRIYQNPKETVVTWDRIRIYVGNGVTISGTISPMLCVDSTSRTFAPYSNICPISGHTGVNVQRDGTNLLNLVESEMISTGWNRSFPFSIWAGTFTISCQNQFGNPDALGCAVSLVDENDTTLVNCSAYTFGNSVYSNSFVVSEENAKKTKRIRFACRAGGTTFAQINGGQIQFELGTTASDYEEYQGTTYPITWETAGTVYGGFVDVLAGELTVETAKRIYDGVNNKFNLMSDSGAFKFITDTQFIEPVNTTSTNNPPTLWCNLYNAKGIGAYGNTYVSGSYFRVCADPSFENVAAFNTFLESNNLEYVYKLATPVTYQLSAQQISSLLGMNNLWNDINGDNTVSFYTH